MLEVSPGKSVLIVKMISVDAYFLHPPLFKGGGLPIADYLVRF
jgi:hypothetical protein